jgi:hypothetical protein
MPCHVVSCRDTNLTIIFPLPTYHTTHQWHITHITSHHVPTFSPHRYDADAGSFNDYADYSIQFAYVTMFVSASPLSCAIALANNYMGLRIHTWAFCQFRARPMPVSVEDIGTWSTILELISYIAVLTSAGIVAFTSNLAVNISWFSRVWVFVGMLGGMSLIKYVFRSILLPFFSSL